MRFAKMQVLAGLVTLLKKYNVEVKDKTQTTVEFDPITTMSLPKDPVKLKVTTREGWESRCFVKS